MIDILAFGPHPDDVEIGCGGMLALQKKIGHSFGMVDLTAGEKGTNGTAAERQQEAQEAANILEASFRLCLQMPDTDIMITRDNLNKIISILRKYRPKIVLAPFWGKERHPDHGLTGQMVQRAVFLAGLKKLELPGEPFRPHRLYYFLLTTSEQPHFVVDVTPAYKLKEEALKAHASQFFRQAARLPTMVNNPNFLHYVRSRDAYFGSLVGTTWGEGLVCESMLKATDLLSWEGVSP